MFEGKVNGCFFTGRFDSGNLYSVEQHQLDYSHKHYSDHAEYDFLSNSDRFYSLCTRPDALGSGNESSNRSWFHFCIKNDTQSSLNVCINITNLNKHNKLYQQGMRPVIRNSGSIFVPNSELNENFYESGWKRLRSTSFAYGTLEDHGFCISFPLSLPKNEYFYLAFCYPFSYKSSIDLIEMVSSICKKEEIFLDTFTLCQSYENRDVNLMVLTSNDAEPVYSEAPEKASNFTPKAAEALRLDFPDKKILVVTARVHPGETPGQLSFSGFLKFVLSDDARAKILLRNFVIYCIPILNPDGVYQGNYRTDVLGFNLNRYYLEPDPIKHPQCLALTNLMDHLTNRRSVNDVFFMDMHAHAAKRGMFLFGNNLPLHATQITNVFYAKLAEQNSLFFDFEASNFTQKNMQHVDKRDGCSRDGCSRVAFFKLFGITHCYTLESNYNSGRWPSRRLQPLTDSKVKQSWLPELQESLSTGSPSGAYLDERYWLEIGGSLMVSVLDLYQLLPNSVSRLVNRSKLLEITEKGLPTYVRQNDAKRVQKTVKKNLKNDVQLRPKNSFTVKPKTLPKRPVFKRETIKVFLNRLLN